MQVSHSSLEIDLTRNLSSLHRLELAADQRVTSLDANARLKNGYRRHASGYGAIVLVVMFRFDLYMRSRLTMRLMYSTQAKEIASVRVEI